MARNFHRGGSQDTRWWESRRTVVERNSFHRSSEEHKSCIKIAVGVGANSYADVCDNFLLCEETRVAMPFYYNSGEKSLVSDSQRRTMKF